MYPHVRNDAPASSLAPAGGGLELLRTLVREQHFGPFTALSVAGVGGADGPPYRQATPQRTSVALRTRTIGTFTWQGRDFGAWLVTIARNLVADHFKSSRFRLEVTTGEMLDSNECERSPEDSVLESLSNAALLEAVHRLNPQQRECVRLRFLQGLSVAETARIMGKNEGAIKTLQYRAVRTLARLLPSDAR